MHEQIGDDNFVIIAAAQDAGGAAIAGPWYERAGATYVTLVDETHELSAKYALVNVPSAVWIDEAGKVRRIDEGTYATTHKMGDFEFGRDDYAPMVVDWVKRGEQRAHLEDVRDVAKRIAEPGADAALAEPTFRLGVYFHTQGDDTRANRYWQAAQRLNPDNWNYYRQDWSFTPDEAGANWSRKFQELEGKPYYKPITGLDGAD